MIYDSQNSSTQTTVSNNHTSAGGLDETQTASDSFSSIAAYLNQFSEDGLNSNYKSQRDQASNSAMTSVTSIPRGNCQSLIRPRSSDKSMLVSADHPSQGKPNEVSLDENGRDTIVSSIFSTGDEVRPNELTSLSVPFLSFFGYYLSQKLTFVLPSNS